jgi:hypothetical protein
MVCYFEQTVHIWEKSYSAFGSRYPITKSLKLTDEEFCLVGYNAVKYVESQLTFWRNMSPPSSRSKNRLSKKPA